MSNTLLHRGAPLQGTNLYIPGPKTGLTLLSPTLTPATAPHGLWPEPSLCVWLRAPWPALFVLLQLRANSKRLHQSYRDRGTSRRQTHAHTHTHHLEVCLGPNHSLPARQSPLTNNQRPYASGHGYPKKAWPVTTHKHTRRLAGRNTQTRRHTHTHRDAQWMAMTQTPSRSRRAKQPPRRAPPHPKPSVCPARPVCETTPQAQGNHPSPRCAGGPRAAVRASPHGGPGTPP